MFRVPVEGPTDIFCDNEVVYKNTSIPEWLLRKKHHRISYHRCREAVAAGTVRIAKEGTKMNFSYVFTNIMSIVRREEILEKFTY